MKLSSATESPKVCRPRLAARRRIQIRKWEFGKEGKTKILHRKSLFLPATRLSVIASPEIMRGDGGREIVGKALRYTSNYQGVLDEIRAAINDGEPLGYALCHFWINEWR